MRSVKERLCARRRGDKEHIAFRDMLFSVQGSFIFRLFQVYKNTGPGYRKPAFWKGPAAASITQISHGLRTIQHLLWIKHPRAARALCGGESTCFWFIHIQSRVRVRRARWLQMRNTALLQVTFHALALGVEYCRAFSKAISSLSHCAPKIHWQILSALDHLLSYIVEIKFQISWFLGVHFWHKLKHGI